MSLNFDPIGLVRDVLSKKREDKDLNSLTGRFYEVRSNGQTNIGFLSSFKKVGNSVWLLMEAQNGVLTIAFDKVDSMREVTQKYRLVELLQITKSRDDARATSLSWLIEGARPVRDKAKKWFDEEVARARHQVHLLVDLFPHRNYQNLEVQLNGIVTAFDASISMLDKVLSLVQNREVTRVKEIYHKERRQVSELEQEEEPDVVVAFAGLFTAASSLDDLVKRIDGIVDSYEDMMTIFKIASQDERSGASR